MREAYHRLQETLAGLRSKRSTPEIPGEQIPADQIPQTAVNLATGAKDIKIAVTPKPGNPLFDSLPQIIESAPPDSKIDIVFMVDEATREDAQALEQMQQIMELAEKRNMRNLFPNAEVDNFDLENLDLEMQGGAEFEYLSVFIRDPEDPKRYWYRKIGAKPTVQEFEGVEIPAVDMALIPMPSLEEIPCLEENLDTALKSMVRIEESMTENPELAWLRGSVAVARYNGQKQLSIDAVIKLAALKYAQMREDFLRTNPSDQN